MLLSKSYRVSEFIILFILLPVSFIFEYAAFLKVVLALLAFVYIIVLLLKVYNNKFKVASDLNWTVFWRNTLVKLCIIAILTTLYVWLVSKENLFSVVLNKPILWGVILVIYSVTSVYPQELIYRTFFFQRYEDIFKSKAHTIIINALVFSLAHLLFWNSLVMVLTFLGGLVFALTFYQTRSTLLVSIEHALYGCWLFTVGMGNMLGFPS